MKRILTILLSLLLLLTIVGCGSQEGTEPDKVEQDELEQKEEEIEESNDDTIVEEVTVGEDIIVINSVEQSKDEEDNDNVVIEFTWTNNSDETTNWVSGVFDQVFQDGQELETATIKDDDYENVMKEIRPGTTLEGVRRAYTPISENPLELELALHSDFEDESLTVINLEFPK